MRETNQWPLAPFVAAPFTRVPFVPACPLLSLCEPLIGAPLSSRALEPTLPVMPLAFRSVGLEVMPVPLLASGPTYFHDDQCSGLPLCVPLNRILAIPL